MGGVQKKECTRFREYEDWWSSVHLLRCDAEDYAAGRARSFYTENSLSRNLLLKRALQSYVTIRDKILRFRVRDPTKEEAEEIMELAERSLRVIQCEKHLEGEWLRWLGERLLP